MMNAASSALQNKTSVISLGASGLDRGVESSGALLVRLQWQPVGDGSPEVAWSLAQLVGDAGDADCLGSRIDRANAEVLERILTAQAGMGRRRGARIRGLAGHGPDAAPCRSADRLEPYVRPDEGGRRRRNPPSAIFIGEWGVVIPSLELTNTMVTGNHWYACEQYASGGTVSLTSGGHDLFQDASCNPVASDLIISDAQIGALADNGGPTSTHALLPGSPALDAADDASGPPLDQRGMARPAGAHCDIGSYEAQLP